MTLKLIAIGALGTMLGPSAEHLNPDIAQYLRVLDRGKSGEQRDKRRAAWREHGAELVSSLEQLLGEGDFDGLVICAGKNGDDFAIFKQLLPLLQNLQPSVKPYFILHMSTVSCDFVRATFAYCQRYQVQYANYPLTGGAAGAQNAQMLILASGDQSLYQRVEPMLQCIGVPQYFGEDVAQGAAVKLIGHVMVFHGLLGISLAAVLHKNVLGLSDLSKEQVPFFDFLNKGAGGTRQWDVALRQSLLEEQWQRGFLIHYAVIDALYTVNLMLEKNLPRRLILPLLEVILLFCLVLQKDEKQGFATQSIAHLLAQEPSPAIDAFLTQRLSWDVEASLKNCIAALPAQLRKILMLEVSYD